MGFRSTFVTEDMNITWPIWFREKYPHLNFGDDNNGQLSTKFEIKIYEDDIFKDIQKVLVEVNFCLKFTIAVLHECGGINRVDITKDKVEYAEIKDWGRVDFLNHNYCYYCEEFKD